MLLPNKMKHRKVFKGKIRGTASAGNYIAYGSYALQSLGNERITIRIFPHTPVTRKPQDVKMGSGKGNPEFFVAKVKPGTILFEMADVTEVQAREAMRLAAHKLPVRTRFITDKESI